MEKDFILPESQSFSRFDLEILPLEDESPFSLNENIRRDDPFEVSSALVKYSCLPWLGDFFQLLKCQEDDSFTYFGQASVRGDDFTLVSIDDESEETHTLYLVKSSNGTFRCVACVQENEEDGEGDGFGQLLAFGEYLLVSGHSYINLFQAEDLEIYQRRFGVGSCQVDLASQTIVALALRPGQDVIPTRLDGNLCTIDQSLDKYRAVPFDEDFPGQTLDFAVDMDGRIFLLELPAFGEVEYRTLHVLAPDFSPLSKKRLLSDSIYWVLSQGHYCEVILYQETYKKFYTLCLAPK